MRLKHAKLFIIVIVLANIILFYYSWKSLLWKTVLDSSQHDSNNNNANSLGDKNGGNKNSKDKIKTTNKHIRKSITIVFRSFYHFENDLKGSLDSILEIIPNMPILVVQDTIPYPPIVYNNNATATSDNSVKFMSLGFDISKTAKELSPLLAIRTKFVLFMPDSVRLNNKNLLQKLLKEINSITSMLETAGASNDDKLSINNNNNGNNNHNNFDNNIKKNERIIVIPFAGNMKSFSSCCQINLDLPNWTIEYDAVNTSEKCDLYLQKHALLADISILREMPDALFAPFPELFYIQAKIAGIKKKIFPLTFQDGKRLFTSFHTKQRRMEIRRKQFKEMYKKLQIKRIIKKSHKIISKTEGKDPTSPQHNLVLDTQFSSSNFSLPLLTEIDLIGCERTTKSCIGPVYAQKPFYVYQNKHTPPCCLEKLKAVFFHVLEEFENVGIRYWLDNLALQYAIERNQLSPDAYEIDISFNSYDLERSSPLKKSQSRPFTDSEGFYWIKATDGQYFRVQFSKINQIGINLLPFEIDGNRIKPNGFFGWKAKEFSSEFLHPMSTVLFLGKNVMCPNNVREFLDFKNIK